MAKFKKNMLLRITEYPNSLFKIVNIDNFNNTEFYQLLCLKTDILTVGKHYIKSAYLCEKIYEPIIFDFNAIWVSVLNET